MRRAKADGLKVTADDVSINSLHLTDVDIGFFDSRARLSPRCASSRDRDALSAALADGTIDVLVSDHNPVDDQTPRPCPLPNRARCDRAGCCCRWRSSGRKTRACRCSAPWPPSLLNPPVLGTALGTLQTSVGRLVEGGVADLCVFDPRPPGRCRPTPCAARNEAHAVFGLRAPGCVRATLVGGHVAFERG